MNVLRISNVKFTTLSHTLRALTLPQHSTNKLGYVYVCLQHSFVWQIKILAKFINNFNLTEASRIFLKYLNLPKQIRHSFGPAPINQTTAHTQTMSSREEPAASGAKTASIDKELDLSNAGRGVWLVKVPKYIANKWEKAPGTIEVGKLKITKQHGQKAAVSLTLSDAVINLDPQERIPREHRLDVSVVTKQTLGVFSHMIRE